MKEKIDGLRESFEQELSRVKSSEAVEKLRVAYLGRKGSVTELLKGLKDVEAAQKKELGQHINLLKKQVEERLAQKIESIKADEEGPVWLTGEYFADSLALPGGVTTEDVEVALRNIGIFLK